MITLNTLAPAPYSKFNPKRLGRGIGSGTGKTCGKGHKGQKARAGGYHRINFEGGQMPLQRRLPKQGFRSRLARIRDVITLTEIAQIAAVQPEPRAIDLHYLIDIGFIRNDIRAVKVIKSGEIDVPVHLKGLGITAGARAVLEAIKGTVIEVA